jgi:hypothetical protein
MTMMPTNFPDYSSVFSTNQAPPATKPGTDWAALGAGVSDFLGGVGDLFRGIQGAPASYRVAGSRLQEYLQGQKEDTYLNNLLSSILASRTKDYESFDPKSRTSLV